MIPISPCHVPTSVVAPDGRTLWGLDEYPKDPRGLIGLTAHGVKDCWVDNAYQLKPAHLQGEGWVIDLGASFGPFSFFAASLGAKVIAVEPNLLTYGCLVKNVVENDMVGRIYPVWCAVGGKPGRAKLTSALTASRVILGEGNHRPATFDVEVMTLTGILDAFGLDDVSFCKMDCESSEYEVIASMEERDLARIRRLVIETHQNFDGINEPRKKALIAKLLPTHDVHSYPSIFQLDGGWAGRDVTATRREGCK